MKANNFLFCIKQKEKFLNQNIWKRLVHLFYLFILQLFLFSLFKNYKYIREKIDFFRFTENTSIFFVKIYRLKFSLAEVESNIFVIFKEGFRNHYNYMLFN